MFSIAADVKNTLGECPLWCDRTRRLYWTDIKGSELLAQDEENNVLMRWPLPERLGSFALTEKVNILLMGVASRQVFYDLNTHVFTPLTASPGRTGTRIGDGRCDHSGNFVFGTMDDGYPVKVVGQFHRLNAATLSIVTLHLPEVAIPNSICFSPDGGILYYCDSMQNRIFCCDYPSLNNQRVFTETKGKVHLTAHVGMQWVIYGMPNGEEIVLYVTARTGLRIVLCPLRLFRAPALHWVVKT